MDKRTAIVIGAGIVGLATARALALKGFSVKVFDRHSRATGASVRNFGMIWPIGQPTGILYERALRSRSIWKEIAGTGAFWYEPSGSLHLAYCREEWQVLQELQEAFRSERKVKLVRDEQLGELSGAIVPENLLGGLYSKDELLVDPREAISALPEYLQETCPITFAWDKCVSYVADGTVYIGLEEEYEADVIFICSGADFETLYPESFATLPLTKCKLQMMRLKSQPGN